MSADDGTSAERVIAELNARGLAPLLRQVCAARGVTELELCGRRRTRSVALARHELWWRIRTQPERCYSFPEIAGWFRRDHSTIFHGVAAFERRVLADQQLF
jgi:chromosomal replication initiation ATPase DnaA